jgi:hypothetical protein
VKIGGKACSDQLLTVCVSVEYFVKCSVSKYATVTCLHKLPHVCKMSMSPSIEVKLWGIVIPVHCTVW